MSHAEKCLICKGKGVVYKPPETLLDTLASVFVLRSFFEETCRACRGEGWIRTWSMAGFGLDLKK